MIDNTRPMLQLTGKSSHPDHVTLLTDLAGEGGLSWMFLRGNQVLRVVGLGEDGYIPPRRDSDDNGPATMTALTGRMLSTLMAGEFFVHVVVKKINDDTGDEEEIPLECWFPTADADRALEVPDLMPGVRPLRGVTHAPLLRPSGGLLDTPGYDKATGFLYHPTGHVPAVPAAPSPHEVRRATTLLRGLVSDFTWDGEHDEANFLGLLLTPLMRLVTPPPYKLGAIGAHQRGSGKSLLAKIIRTVHGGTLRSWPTTEEEVGKQITGILTQTTAPVCQIDNVRGRVESGKLEALLTSATYSDRVLGTTNDTDMINDRLWVMTGNNMNLAGDLDRRVVWAVIDPGVERPEDRTGFTIPDLAGHVAEHRGEILAALLTWLTAWDAAGRPAGLPTEDDYGRWVSAVRGVLTMAGVPGEFDHTESRRQEEDPTTAMFGGFLAAVEDVFSDGEWTVSELCQAMRVPREFQAVGHETTDAERLFLALPADLTGQLRPGQSPQTLATSLGYWLRNRKGAWFDGRRVISTGKGKRGQRWRVMSGGRALTAVT